MGVSEKVRLIGAKMKRAYIDTDYWSSLRKDKTANRATVITDAFFITTVFDGVIGRAREEDVTIDYEGAKVLKGLALRKERGRKNEDVAALDIVLSGKRITGSEKFNALLKKSVLTQAKDFYKLVSDIIE